MPRRPVQIVWFKRDLRVTDHAPLDEASREGPVLPMFVVEPDCWLEPDASGRQFDFVRESLAELRAALAALGQPLVLRVGRAEEVLEALRQSVSIAALWSHEETGNGWTFARDRRVAAWAAEHGIPWHERPQTGVVRRLASRDGWARRWERRMREPIRRPPSRLIQVAGIEPGELPADLLPGDGCPGRQPGGRNEALALLRSFLTERGRPYRRAMSAPDSGAEHCSRLSPHLAWGTLSAREVLQATEARQRALTPTDDPSWQGALSSFAGRLRWRCHFMQKLESEPALEDRCLHPAYEGMRGTDQRLLAAWAGGLTGWPFVDACMRMLQSTGWLNFRMRAMLMSVATQQLWLDWRPTGRHLARLFTDYEAGIHWSQAQMQSGSTGINTIRIYNPIKQGLDQDPDGSFVRRWCPELADVPTLRLHMPWVMSPLEQETARCRIGHDYPAPVVDHEAAARRARQAVWGVRRGDGYGVIADAIQERHGSRRSGLPQPRTQRPKPDRQLALRL